MTNIIYTTNIITNKFILDGGGVVVDVITSSPPASLLSIAAVSLLIGIFMGISIFWMAS